MITRVCILIAAAFLASSRLSAAAPEDEAVAVDTLIAQARNYDGKEVVIVGELVGDIMARKEGCWLNILGKNGVAIGVMADRNSIRDVSIAGDYSHHGDYLRVKGTMYRFAANLGGETCIIAKEVTTIRKGYPVAHSLSWKRLAAGIVLTGASIIFGIIVRIQAGSTAVGGGNVPR
ncbi:MAG: hypothetical protein NTZ78_10175 [Candidatus Aureabacteria bacterium]|nr:hypothetical protein [Candidatus Auribacterota bacterium]